MMRDMLAMLCCAALVVLLVAVPTIGSAPISPVFKIGFIDQQRVLLETDVGKGAQENMKSLQNRKQAEMDRMEQELKALSEKISNELLPLTDEARDNLRREQRMKKTDMEIFVNEAYEEAEAINKKNVKKIRKLVEETVSVTAKQKGYAIILEKMGVVLYGNPKYDVTDDVIRLINERTRKQKEQGAK